MRVKESVAGSVLAYREDGTAIFLMPGEEVPPGVVVDESLVVGVAPARRRKARQDGSRNR